MGSITLGIAESNIAKAPDKIVTLGLGSCVGLVLFDPVTRLGGMVHIMLPCAPKDAPVVNKYKFADTGILELMRLMIAAGAIKRRLIAKLAGGAHMFNTSYNKDIMNIGQRNIEMCHKVLAENAIAIAAEDTGGSNGRSIEFNCESSMLEIRTVSPRTVRYI